VLRALEAAWLPHTVRDWAPQAQDKIPYSSTGAGIAD
jgi:hypothetical protein